MTRQINVSIRNIWNPGLLLTVTERDEPLTPGAADEVVEVVKSHLVCRWRVLRGCSPH